METDSFGGGRVAASAFGDVQVAGVLDCRDDGSPDGGISEYLLRGYFRTLIVTGDTARLAACATDAARHERMLDITGGDAAALDEVTITLT